MNNECLVCERTQQYHEFCSFEHFAEYWSSRGVQTTHVNELTAITLKNAIQIA